MYTSIFEKFLSVFHFSGCNGKTVTELCLVKTMSGVYISYNLELLPIGKELNLEYLTLKIVFVNKKSTDN